MSTRYRRSLRTIPLPTSRRAAYAGLLACAAALTGCQSYDAPKLSVTGAAAHERTSEGVSMVITLDAQNTNDVPLPLREIEYTLDIDGRRVFAGTRSAEATLRSMGVQSIRLPAVVQLSGEQAALGNVRYQLAGTLKYVTPGQVAEVLFDSGVRVPSVDFSGSGDIDLGAATLLSAPGVPQLPQTSPLPDTAPPPVMEPTIAP